MNIDELDTGYFEPGCHVHPISLPRRTVDLSYCFQYNKITKRRRKTLWRRMFLNKMKQQNRGDHHLCHTV